jgi:hypothetical protein
MTLGVLAWITAALLLYAVVVNGLWLLRHGPRRYATWLDPIESSHAATLGRGLYLLGIPVLAVALRVPGLSAPVLGLPAPGVLDQPRDVLLQAIGRGSLWSLGLAAAVGAAVVAGDLWYRRSMARPARLTRGRLTPAGLGVLALGALCLEAHWAFFRAGLLSLGLQNQTLAVYLALALLGLEAWINPATRAALGDPEALAPRTRTAALAILSGSVFLATGSSLASLLAHVIAASAWMLAGFAVIAADAQTVAAPAQGIDAIEPTVV